MTNTGYTAYNQIAAVIDSKEVILLKLLDGTVRFVQAARAGIDAGSPKTKGENISKAIAIISELDCALDREIGGSLVENLSLLYRYILGRLTRANLKNDSQILLEVEGLLMPIKEGFMEALRQMSSDVSSDQSPSYHQPVSQKGLCIAA